MEAVVIHCNDASSPSRVKATGAALTSSSLHYTRKMDRVFASAHCRKVIMLLSVLYVVRHYNPVVVELDLSRHTCSGFGFHRTGFIGLVLLLLNHVYNPCCICEVSCVAKRFGFYS
jgi:hypothetical protein